MTIIRKQDFINSVRDALQYISYYHSPDFIRAMRAAWETEESPAARVGDNQPPLAVDAEHPFPFISNDALNIGAWIPVEETGQERFVRVKVPDNRPRWVPLEDEQGFVPLEQVIAANLDRMFGGVEPASIYFFRVTRAAKDNPWDRARFDDHRADELEPGSIIGMVTAELNFRKFAGIVRLEVSDSIPEDLRNWLVDQLEIDHGLVMPLKGLIGCADLLNSLAFDQNISVACLAFVDKACIGNQQFVQSGVFRETAPARRCGARRPAPDTGLPSRSSPSDSLCRSMSMRPARA